MYPEYRVHCRKPEEPLFLCIRLRNSENVYDVAACTQQFRPFADGQLIPDKVGESLFIHGVDLPPHIVCGTVSGENLVALQMQGIIQGVDILQTNIFIEIPGRGYTVVI